MKRNSHIARHSTAVHRSHRRRNQLKAIHKMQHKRKELYFRMENQG